jgi:hypothetical protein
MTIKLSFAASPLSMVSGDCDESNIFEVEPKVLYHNETLDTAILRLKPNGKVVMFPPPFRRLDHFLIPAEDENLTIYCGIQSFIMVKYLWFYFKNVRFITVTTNCVIKFDFHLF